MRLKNNWPEGEMDQRFSEFAEKQIAGRFPALQRSSMVPPDLWTGMQAAGLFGLCLPEPFGGRGCTLPSLLSAGRTLVQSGGNLGIGLSWLIHELTARHLVLPFGTPEQKHFWLPELATGQKTASFAVSEPEAGAHPKLLKTRAEKQGEDYVLNGKKTYLTNGPMADLFIVIAKTGIEGGRNRYSTFLVPRETPGLTVSEPMQINFLRPAPHGSILLDDCRIPQQQLLGPEGEAWESMVLGFREIEDIFMAGLLIGGLDYVLSRICDAPNLSGKLEEDVFDAHVDLCGLWAVAEMTAQLLEKAANFTYRGDLALFFRQHAGQLVEQIGRIGDQAGVASDAGVAAMAADLSAALRIGRSAVSARKRKRQAQFFERN